MLCVDIAYKASTAAPQSQPSTPVLLPLQMKDLASSQPERVEQMLARCGRIYWGLIDGRTPDRKREKDRKSKRDRNIQRVKSGGVREEGVCM